MNLIQIRNVNRGERKYRSNTKRTYRDDGQFCDIADDENADATRVNVPNTETVRKRSESQSQRSQCDQAKNETAAIEKQLFQQLLQGVQRVEANKRPKKFQWSDKRECFYYHEIGHLIKECPKKKKCRTSSSIPDEGILASSI